ncbi:hypothetical protein R5R35_007449 [Gryllus longicercus]|uniref:Adenosine kinase n=1 Tax=Gryllus longicercus TaxID=2509291 RepID=A0AAN9VD19_9ORTH
MNTSDIEKAFKPPIITAFGNVLLDIEAIIIDESIIKKFDLEAEAQKEIDEAEYVVLLEETTTKCNIAMRCPGGSAQNTLRWFQWLIQLPNYSVIFGGIGTDDNGEFLERAVTKDGVRTRYAYHQEFKTGTCISFINGKRSLVAHLGAANHYSANDLDIPENWEILKNALMIYVEGFFITHSFEVAMLVASFCHTNGNCFGMNLNAPYVCQKYGDRLLNLMQYADIIFGHSSEFLALSNFIISPVNSPQDVASFIQKRSLLKEKKKRKKNIPPLLQNGPIIIITASSQPVSVFQGLSEDPLVFPVPHLDKAFIKDTTGAGDAFVAGFLSAAFANMDLEKCVKNGCSTSHKIIQQIGVSVPSHSPERSSV